MQAELLTGLSVKTIEDAEKAVIMILERGARRAVITLGNKGSVIGTKENRIPKHIPVTAVEPVDTTVMLNMQNFHTRNFPEVVSVYALPSINMFCLLFSLHFITFR